MEKCEKLLSDTTDIKINYRSHLGAFLASKSICHMMFPLNMPMAHHFRLKIAPILKTKLAQK